MEEKRIVKVSIMDSYVIRQESLNERHLYSIISAKGMYVKWSLDKIEFSRDQRTEQSRLSAVSRRFGTRISSIIERMKSVEDVSRIRLAGKRHSRTDDRRCWNEQGRVTWTGRGRDDSFENVKWMMSRDSVPFVSRLRNGLFFLLTDWILCLRWKDF